MVMPAEMTYTRLIDIKQYENVEHFYDKDTLIVIGKKIGATNLLIYLENHYPDQKHVSAKDVYFTLPDDGDVYYLEEFLAHYGHAFTYKL